jgi:hypothetical protein
MKERPVILGPEDVRLIVAGGKTQLREPVSKFMTINKKSDIKYYLDGVLDAHGKFFRYPYGCEGDRIWVREPFKPETILYKADGEHGAVKYTVGGFFPSVYMPRWASRLTMDIEEVHIERLKTISEADAAAEGSDILEFPDMWNRKIKDKDNCWSYDPWVWVYKFSVI